MRIEPKSESLAATRNVVSLSSALEGLGRADERFLLVVGPAGTGKSTAARKLAERCGGVYYSAREGETARSLLSALVNALCGWSVDFYSVQKLRERLLDELEERGWPPVFLDEADRLDRQRNGVHFLDIVRDLHDHGHSAFVLLSIQRLARKWASPTSYFEAFTTRTAARIDFERPDLGDAEVLARAACRVRLGSDLVADCLSASGGSMRPLMARFREVEKTASAAGLGFIDLAAWQRLCALSGDAPARGRHTPSAQLVERSEKERAA